MKDRESSRCCEGPTLSAFKEPESLVSAEASIFQAVWDTFAFYNSCFRVRFASFLQEDSYYEKCSAERFLNVSTVCYITVKLCYLKIWFSMSNMSLNLSNVI